MDNLENKFCKFRDISEKKLSKLRYEHCKNVAKSAVELARKYGEDEEKAYVAGLLHDITKELNEREHLDLMRSYGESFSPEEIKAPKLWHQKTAALYVKFKLNISDNDIISAISCHTSAKADMSELDKIVYLADLISKDRDYQDVENVRLLAFQNLNEAMLKCLQFSIRKLLDNEKIIITKTIQAYNQFLSQHIG